MKLFYNHIYCVQVHGRGLTVSLEPSVALAADSPANMMPWAGDPKVIIDRLKWLDVFFIPKLFLLKLLDSFKIGLTGGLL